MNLSPHWASPRRQYLLAKAESYNGRPALASARSIRKDRKWETFASRQEVNDRRCRRSAKDVHPGRSWYMRDETQVSRDVELSDTAAGEAWSAPSQKDRGTASQGPGTRPNFKGGGFWQRISYGGRSKETEADVLADHPDAFDPFPQDVLYPDVMAGLGLHAKSILHGHGERSTYALSRALVCPPPKLVREPTQPGRHLHPSLDELSQDLLRERGGTASLKDWPPPGFGARDYDALVKAEVTHHGEGLTAGVDAHFNSYSPSADWTHPYTLAYNSPAADGYRVQKWQHQKAFAAKGLSPAGVEELLRRCCSTADRVELLELAPRVMAHCYEARKEDALRCAVRFGEAARSAQAMAETEQCNALQEAALALIASVATRGRDAHGPELLVEGLVTMQEAGVGHKIYVDMLLSALFNWSSRAPFPEDLALRAATALSWAAAALTDSVPSGSIRLAAGSRRAVAAIRAALPDNTAHVNAHLLEVLDDLISGAAWDADLNPLVEPAAAASNSPHETAGEQPTDTPNKTDDLKMWQHHYPEFVVNSSH